MFKFLWTAEEPEEDEPPVYHDKQKEESQDVVVVDQPSHNNNINNNNNNNMTQPRPAQTWKQAHLDYCRQHSLLVASPQRVLQSLADGDEISWTLPPVESAVVVTMDGDKQNILQAILKPKEGQASTTTTGGTSSSSSSSYKLLSRVVGAVSNVVWNPQDDDDDYEEHVDWNQAGDHAAVVGSSHSQPSGIVVEWNDPLLCVELIIPCWHRLQKRLARIDPSPHLLKRIEWNEWLGQDNGNDDGDDDSILSSMGQKDADLLLDLLIIHQQAKLVIRPGTPELIALGASAFDSNNNNNAVDAAVTIWDLDVAMQSTERQLETWAVQVSECEKKALDCRQQKQPKQALFQMGRRQLLQRQMESSAQIVIKLEQTKLAVWQAQSQTSLVGTLGLATKTLQELRTATSLELVEDVQDNLQEELDLLSEVQSSLVGHDQQQQHDEDEDEALLQELQELTVEDETQTTESIDEELADGLEEFALSLPVAPTTGMVVQDELEPKDAMKESAS